MLFDVTKAVLPTIIFLICFFNFTNLILVDNAGFLLRLTSKISVTIGKTGNNMMITLA
jgi:hypothetical protein